jgi:hypothetical protein
VAAMASRVFEMRDGAIINEHINVVAAAPVLNPVVIENTQTEILPNLSSSQPILTDPTK